MEYRGFDWRQFVRTPWAVLAIWLAWCVVRLAIQPMLGWEPVGPDDWTRLLQVRSWLDGQSFWDVSQYRMNPPEGFLMHWSRLVDLPLALLAVSLGETAAMALVPLLWLLPALFALRAILARLGVSDLAFLFGLTLLPLMPLLPASFAPMRIDHHTPQAVVGLICAALLLSPSRWAAMAAGLCAALWVLISLEGLPLIAIVAGLYGLRYLWTGDRLLVWFLGALSASAAIVGFATVGPYVWHPASLFHPPFCDILLPGHVAAFAAAFLASLLIAWLPSQHTRIGRLAGLLPIAIASSVVAVPALGYCLANPMQQLDPVLQTYWHGYITEGLPIWKQPVSIMLMTVWTIALIIAGAWTARREWLNDDRGHGLEWATLLLLALAAGAYSLLVMRVGVVTQLLAIPFAAILLAHWLPRARAVSSAVPRIIATIAVFGLATPMFASAFAKPLDAHFPMATMRPDVLALVEQGECDYDRLAILDAGLVLAPLDAGPRILGLSDHTIVAASYHRNQQAMRDVLHAFTSSPEEARQIIADYRADYVVVCGSAADVALYRTAAEDNFANAAISDTPPDWLQLDEDVSAGSLRVYRLR